MAMVTRPGGLPASSVPSMSKLSTIVKRASSLVSQSMRSQGCSATEPDFFAVPTLLFQTLYVFVVISHGRRRIEHLNVTTHPTAVWVWRELNEATP